MPSRSERSSSQLAHPGELPLQRLLQAIGDGIGPAGQERKDEGEEGEGGFHGAWWGWPPRRVQSTLRM